MELNIVRIVMIVALCLCASSDGDAWTHGVPSGANYITTNSGVVLTMDDGNRLLAQ